MNCARMCRRLTPILFVGCLLLAVFASAVTIAALRRGDRYFSARRPVEERRRALQAEIDPLQQRQAELLAASADPVGETAAPAASEESAQLARQIESLRQERYALYDQRRSILAKERADGLLGFHDTVRLPMIDLQIICLVALVASRLLETALASAPRAASRVGGAARASI